MNISEIEDRIQNILTTLRDTRKQRGLSQREVAEFLYLSKCL